MIIFIIKSILWGDYLKIAVCDDEKIMRSQVKMYLDLMHKPMCVDEYSNGMDLIRSNIMYDIIFLDIEMPSISGMNVAQKLRSNNIDSYIIFLTSHTEYVLEAFKVRAFRFLTKPLDQVAFNEAFANAENEIKDIEKILISSHGEYHDVKINEIVYIEASGDGTYVYDRFGNVYESSLQLKEWESKLAEKQFYKIHKSYIVSMLYVKNIENNQLTLINIKQPLIISRRNLSGFRETYINYIKTNARVL